MSKTTYSVAGIPTTHETMTGALAHFAATHNPLPPFATLQEYEEPDSGGDNTPTGRSWEVPMTEEEECCWVGYSVVGLHDTYSTVAEALNAYREKFRGSNPSFVVVEEYKTTTNRVALGE